MRTLTEVGDDLEELGEPVLDSDLLAFWALITIIGFWGPLVGPLYYNSKK